VTRFSHIARELARNTLRHPIAALGSLLTLTLIFGLFDVFWVAAGSAQRFYDNLLSELRMEAFVSEETPESGLMALHDRLEEMPGINDVRYVSKDSARAKLAAMIGTDLLVGYEKENPLPRSFVLAFEPDWVNSADLETTRSALLGQSEVVDVFYPQNWLAKVESIRNLVLTAGFILGAVILAAALIGATLNIRLMTETRASGFEQMRLLGAGRTFLALPFLLEGFLIAGLAAAIGWLLVGYSQQWVSLVRIEIVLPPVTWAIAYCAAAALLGALSGFLGVRRMLK